MTGHDLHHHGDHDLGDGLVDLAVNVRVSAPPPWLAAVITDTVGRLAGYPRPDEAVQAIAAAHRLSPAQVLPTAGGAEAFTLLARAIDPEHPVIVHPQFTEPEAALIAAGHRPDRVILTPASGFSLDLAGHSRGRRSDHDRQPDQPDERAAPGSAHPPVDPARTAGRGRRGVHGCGARAGRVDDRRRDAGPDRAALVDQDLGPGRPAGRLCRRRRAGHRRNARSATPVVGVHPRAGGDGRLPVAGGAADRGSGRRRDRPAPRVPARSTGRRRAARRRQPRRPRSSWSTRRRSAEATRPAGSAWPCATTASPSAAARPSRASTPTGSGSPSATRTPPTGSRPPFADLSDSKRAIAS